MDTTRGRLVIWGGGHADYKGNEIYAFDFAERVLLVFDAARRSPPPEPETRKPKTLNADNRGPCSRGP